MPDEPARLDILRIKTRHMRMSDDVDLQALAHDTQGYCGADLAQTVFESAMLCLREKLPGIDLEAETVPSELLLALELRKQTAKLILFRRLSIVAAGAVLARLRPGIEISVIH